MADITELVAEEIERLGLVQRLAQIDRANPRINVRLAEEALAEYFAMRGLSCPPIRWARDAREGWLSIFELATNAAESTVRSAAESVASAAWSAARTAAEIAAHRAARSATENTARFEAIAAWSAAERAAWSAARTAAETAAWNAARTAAEIAAWVPAWTASRRAFKFEGVVALSAPALFALFRETSKERGKPQAGEAMPEAARRWIGIWLALVKTSEAGVWFWWVTESEMIAVPRPSILIENDRVHSSTGPAISWPSGERYWFWRGLQVPKSIIERPETISVAMIDAERNAELRRAMIERYRAGQEVRGAAAYLRDAGAQRLDHDERFGTLWRRDVPRDEPIVMIELVNRTAEPDGSFKHYWLRVHPELRPLPPGHWPEEKKRAWLAQQKPQEMTARAAVASLHGKRAADYKPLAET